MIRENDYLGLDLLAQVDVEARPAVELQIVLEHSPELIDTMTVEVSIDGYIWVGPAFLPQIDVLPTE